MAKDFVQAAHLYTTAIERGQPCFVDRVGYKLDDGSFHFVPLSPPHHRWGMPPPPGFPVAGPVLSSGAVDESSVSAPEDKHERFHMTGSQGLYTDHQFQAPYRRTQGFGVPSHHAGWFEDPSGIRHHYRFPDGGIPSMPFRPNHHPDKTKTSKAKKQSKRRESARDYKTMMMTHESMVDELQSPKGVPLTRTYSTEVANEAGVSLEIARDALSQVGRADRSGAISAAQRIMRHRTEGAVAVPSGRSFTRELDGGAKKATNPYAILGNMGQESDDEIELNEEGSDDGFVML